MEVAAPAALTLEIARDIDLFRLPAVRAIFKARELVLDASSDDTQRPRGLLAEAPSMRRVVPAESREREVVLGAVTKPWEPNVGVTGPSFSRYLADPANVAPAHQVSSRGAGYRLFIRPRMSSPTSTAAG